MSTKLIFIVPVLLLALCVVPCMAYTITNPQINAVYSIGSASSVDIFFTSGVIVHGYDIV